MLSWLEGMQSAHVDGRTRLLQQEPIAAHALASGSGCVARGAGDLRKRKAGGQASSNKSCRTNAYTPSPYTATGTKRSVPPTVGPHRGTRAAETSATRGAQNVLHRLARLFARIASLSVARGPPCEIRRQVLPAAADANHDRVAQHPHQQQPLVVTDAVLALVDPVWSTCTARFAVRRDVVSSEAQWKKGGVGSESTPVTFGAPPCPSPSLPPFTFLTA